MGGGWDRIKADAPSYQNPIGDFWRSQKGKTSDYSIESMAPAVPQIKQETISGKPSIAKQAEAAKYFGDPSPKRGQVTIQSSHIYTSGVRKVENESITIKSSPSNTAPVNITGWSIASAVSGKRKIIPPGTRTYKLGAVPEIEEVNLSPGNFAIINSGHSPVGVSFQTNICSGYLTQFQSFSPNLTNSCPSPSSELPNTLENLQTYGAECIDFVAGLPSCTYHIGSLPENINASCKSFVTNALSYNSCVDRYRWQSDFFGNKWRIYLENDDILWNPLHDVIRLLDESGRTVDVWSY